MTAVVWFRKDLRLADNAALAAAVNTHDRVVPLYVWDPESEGDWAPGAAARWWLHQSLAALSRSLRERESRLVLRRGDCRRTLPEVAKESGASEVFLTRRYEPAARKVDAAVQKELEKAGVATRVLTGSLLVEPDRAATGKGTPYRVFTPFWRRIADGIALEPPHPAPGRVPAPPRGLRSEKLAALGLLPSIRWYEGMARAWSPGEVGARHRLDAFVEDGLRDYAEMRDRADLSGSSRLSPHLAWGEVSPRQVVWAVREAKTPGGGEAFLRELGWREFAHHLLWHFPDTPLEPLDARFRALGWRRDEEALVRWRKGRTGIPLVDAGMRELWETGWMHNRARMVVASFLTKNLLVPWQEGARWFWDTLVDADLANNTLGWQWTAGCGADAAPFFRIFNPVKQSERADPTGGYVRRYVPEIAALPDRYLHRPWKAPAKVLEAAGIELGGDYPTPLVDLAASRNRALDRFARMKKAARGRRPRRGEDRKR